MELHQLRYLRAVVRSGSVTAAAEEEHVAQPSVSRQIALLERELGVPLFHRVGRRVVPTEAGLRMAECAGRVLDDLASTAAALAEPDSLAGGRLRICATETACDHLLPPAIAALGEHYPQARISVVGELGPLDQRLPRLVEQQGPKPLRHWRDDRPARANFRHQNDAYAVAGFTAEAPNCPSAMHVAKTPARTSRSAKARPFVDWCPQMNYQPQASAI